MTEDTAFSTSVFPRLHLFEWHELDWFPPVLRNGVTEILRTLTREMRVHDTIKPVPQKVIQDSGATQVVDLCSGSGGPIVALYAAGLLHLPALLTDKFPNPDAYVLAAQNSGGLVSGYPHAVDATRVPPELTGVRTIFNAFHHFRPASAKAILTDAYRSGQAIAIFEITERSVFNTLTNFILSFLVTLVMFPKMRPFRWSWLLFTYLIPILPLAFGWDGTVSCLRSYTEEEFRELTSELTARPNYEWRTGRLAVPSSPIKVNYFCGVPSE